MTKKGFDQGQLVSVLEAFYALERPDDEWLRESLLALSRVSGAAHDYTAFFYDASDVEHPKVSNPTRLGPLPPELIGVWGVFQATLSPAFARATFRSLFVGSVRKTAIDFMGPILAERERNGHGDMFYLNALDPSGVGCTLMVSARDPQFKMQPSDKGLLERMANHLAAASRCRRRLRALRESAGDGQRETSSTDFAEAIVDGEGRIVHAEGAAREETAREQIKAAAAAIDSSRSRSQRQDGLRALETWHPLTAARWTLVDSFDSDGKRYVVARENQADAPDLGAFTDRERQIVVHAALGQTNKEIAYMLGISESTVRVLVARAARRLGTRTRRELLAHPMLRSLRSTPPSEA